MKYEIAIGEMEQTISIIKCELEDGYIDCRPLNQNEIEYKKETIINLTSAIEVLKKQ